VRDTVRDTVRDNSLIFKCSEGSEGCFALNIVVPRSGGSGAPGVRVLLVMRSGGGFILLNDEFGFAEFICARESKRAFSPLT
jgi:hypothetical protein